MHYHIQTDPIWEAFKEDCDCPLCAIYEKNDNRVVSQYLNEAVMEPDCRISVNKYGFCKEHSLKLFAGKNKLGLALQLHTRTQTVRAEIKPCSSFKQAKKQADELDRTVDSCVICREIEKEMIRYAQTVAQMFAAERDFKPLFTKSNGFCMPHYILLLRHADNAGSKIKEYLSELVYLQNRNLDKTCNELDRFTQMFDYRNAGSAVKPDPETIPKSIRKLKGRIL